MTGRDAGRAGALALGAAAAVIAAAGQRGRGRWADRHADYEFDVPDTVDAPEFARAAAALTAAPVRPGNRIEVLINGDRIFPAMLDAIEGAERTLNLMTYIYWSGEIGERIARAIAARARAGVECRVLLDSYGARKIDAAMVEMMRDGGARVEWFRPLRPGVIRRWNNRNHRRVLVADGRVGLTGGAGIADEWTGDAEAPGSWRDTHARVTGPVVADLQAAFAENWIEATAEIIWGGGQFPGIDPDPGGDPAQLIRSSARVGAPGAELLYLLAISAARERIDILAGHFAPLPAFVRGLTDAARRGARVRVMIPGAHPDSALVRDAGRSAYAELMDGGVEVHEYERTTMHAKTIQVDGLWGSIGTANFDARSFALNDEVTLTAWSASTAGELDAAMAGDLLASRRIDPDRWRRRGPIARLAERRARVMLHQL